MIYYILYKTTNLVTGKYYIGKHVTDDIADGYLGSGIALSNAIKKYGSDNFARETLALFDDETSLNLAEQNMVDSVVCSDVMSYNIALGGSGGCIVLKPDHPLYASTVNKIKEAQLKNSNVLSKQAKELHKKKIIGMHNRSHSDETKTKMSESAKAISHDWLVGRKHNDETKDKIRQKHLGKILSEDTRYKISKNHHDVSGSNNPMFGRKMSEETKLKIRETKAKRKALQESLI